jgi:hypothetical protein
MLFILIISAMIISLTGIVSFVQRKKYGQDKMRHKSSPII